MADEWYGIDALPRGAVHGIVARWPGFEVPAATATDKKGVRSWYEVKGKSLSPLSVPVEAWRPADASRWRWPNGVVPLPLPVHVFPRLAIVGGMTFDAATAAAEMESWREDARSRPDDDIDERDSQWWRDITRVAYEPMGSVSLPMCEARVMRHLILERSLPMPMRRQKSNAAVLADLKRSFADVYGDEPDVDWVPPLRSTPEDHKDFDLVMVWIVEAEVSRRQMAILRARMQSPPATWVQIGDELQLHRNADAARKRAKAIYANTIAMLCDAANRPAVRTVVQIDALRERNRAARRRA